MQERMKTPGDEPGVFYQKEAVLLEKKNQKTFVTLALRVALKVPQALS